MERRRIAAAVLKEMSGGGWGGGVVDWFLLVVMNGRILMLEALLRLNSTVDEACGDAVSAAIPAVQRGTRLVVARQPSKSEPGEMEKGRNDTPSLTAMLRWRAPPILAREDTWLSFDCAA